MKLVRNLANSPYSAHGNGLERAITFVEHYGVSTYTPIGQLTNDIAGGRDCWDEYRQPACRTHDALREMYAG